MTISICMENCKRLINLDRRAHAKDSQGPDGKSFLPPLAVCRNRADLSCWPKRSRREDAELLANNVLTRRKRTSS